MQIKIPNLAEGVDSGTVVTVLVSEGDQIEKEQPILEIETEKAIGTLPSPVAGTVTQIHVKEGDTVSVGQLAFTLAGEGETEREVVAEETPPSAQEPVKGAVQGPEIPQPAGEAAAAAGLAPSAAPSVRKLAADLGIDLTRVRGSARGGRIVQEDLKAYIQRLQEMAFGKPAAPEEAKPVVKALPDFAKWGPVTREKMSSIRRIISRRMHESWSTVPHVTQFDEADITSVMALKKKYGPAFQEKGTRLTLTSFVLKALTTPLQKYPKFNCSIDESSSEIVFKEYYHIGVAVDTEAGLIVPVLRDVDKKDLLEISKELEELATKTRERKISPDELQGGTFTVSNQGGIGGGHFTPIVNSPEVAILGLGRSVPRPVVVNEKLETRLILPVCLSYDHRIIDGAGAVRFVQEFVQALEQFKEESIGF